MVGRLEQDGYVTRADGQVARVHADGLEQAEQIVGRHRLIERFLTDVVGIAWDDVHEEAERLEHAMSPAFEKWMMSTVGDAKTCPHGHPIVPGNRIPGVPLADCEEGADGRDPALRERGRGPAALPQALGSAAGPEGQARRHRTTTRSSCARTATRSPSRAASPRRSRSGPTRRRRRAPRCPSSWCSGRTATGGRAAGRDRPTPGTRACRGGLGGHVGVRSDRSRESAPAAGPAIARCSPRHPARWVSEQRTLPPLEPCRTSNATRG